MLTLIEFLDDNAHRCYPFTDVNELPTDFIVDLHIVTTDNVRKDGVYLNTVTVGDTTVQLNFDVSLITGQRVHLSTPVVLPINDEFNVEHCIKLIDEVYEVIIEGSITVGSYTNLIAQSKARYDLQSSANIFSACVIPVTEWCTGLVINGKLYTGVVHMVFETGFEVYNHGEYIIIQAKGLQLPEGNVDIISDDEMQAIAKNNVGTGVTSINGLTGDVLINTGTYSIEHQDPTYSAVDGEEGRPMTDANNLQITSSENAIIISNAKDNPNYDINSDSSLLNTSIDTLLANASALNDRYQVLDKHNYAVDTAVNLLSNQLSKVN